ncbi:MAG: 4-alpha-glucanotransferase [Actinobacteria bacterium]|nr:4-alpha-glucanotransferase [Actinomycetota bacterium]
MHFTRSSGVLVHPTSLPGPPGIGDIGPSAHAWLDELAQMGCALWQVLPLGPTGYADSPYQSFSSFAGNPNLISPESLVTEGLLDEAEIRSAPAFPDDRVDYGTVIGWKRDLVDHAFANIGGLQDDFERFRYANRNWLGDYALFMTLKDLYGGRSWTLWPSLLRDRDPAQMEKASSAYATEIRRHEFAQFLFSRQWNALHRHARSLGISIIGDIPIFAAGDSADVWANRRLFQLTEAGEPAFQAGVPPDYFSETGQLWGNPLYRWDEHRQTGFAWWTERFRAVLRLVDIVRIDHFRGFVNYWEVPGGALDAVEGRWVDGPGEIFFKTIQRELGTLPIIAEDLGELDPRVPALRDLLGFPGMKVFQFGFDTDRTSEFLPHNYPRNSVAYTGTHDNDTTRGWFESLDDARRSFVLEYLGTDDSEIAWDIMWAVWKSRSVFALAPLQDLLDLPTEARMNRPGTTSGNWQWRATAGAVDTEVRQRMQALNRATRRKPGKRRKSGE